MPAVCLQNSLSSGVHGSKIRSEKYKSKFEGKLIYTNYGKCRVLKYKSSKDILIRFLNTGYKTNTTLAILQRGEVRDPYLKNVCEVGYLGEGKYTSQSHNKIYKVWRSMLQRCYESKSIKNSRYIDCSVSESWLCFQNFCDDVLKMPNWDTLGFELDKDLRIFGNRIYSKETCSFVPSYINGIVQDQPGTGVSKRTDRGKIKYRARMSIGTAKATLSIGSFETKEDAQLAYDRYKERYVQDIVLNYKSQLHKQVYKNLRRFSCQQWRFKHL